MLVPFGKRARKRRTARFCGLRFVVDGFAIARTIVPPVKAKAGLKGRPPGKEE
jgi:hypothetical protein